MNNVLKTVLIVLAGISSLTILKVGCNTIGTVNTNTNEIKKAQTQGLFGDLSKTQITSQEVWPRRIQVEWKNVKGEIQFRTSAGFVKWPDLESSGKPVLARSLTKNYGVYWIVRPL